MIPVAPPEVFTKIHTKSEALRKLGCLKENLRLLNKRWCPKEIVNDMYSNGVVWKTTIHPPPVFTHFYFTHSTINGIFWLMVTDYWVWSDPKFQTFVKVLQFKAKKDGYFFRVAHVHHVYRMVELDRCHANKELFIEVPVKA